MTARALLDRLFRTAIAAAHQGVFDLDFRASILTLSAEAAQMVGLSSHETTLSHADWITLVHADDEIMLITDKGVLVRTRVSEIRELGRATQGVTLIGLDEGSKLSGLQRIVENDAGNGDGDETAPDSQ